jgi:hypothetical protein
MTKRKRYIYAYIYCALISSLVGCTTARIVYSSTTFSKGEVVREEKVTVIPPARSLETSHLTLTPDGSKAIAVSGAQDGAELAKVTGANKGRLILFGVAGLICVIGAVMLGISKIPNKDALEVLSAGAGLIALLYWLPGTIKYMSLIIPIVFMGAVGVFVWRWNKAKNRPLPAGPAPILDP